MKYIIRNQDGLALIGHVLLILTISFATLTALAFKAGESADIFEFLFVKTKIIIISTRYFLLHLV